jgi:GAF domain-containing protein
VRIERVADTFVALADTLADDFDLQSFLDMLTARCVEHLEVAAAALMVVDPDGQPHVVAASTERARALQLFQLTADEGPSMDCYRRLEPAVSGHLGADSVRWPRFVPAARAAGFSSLYALPMRLRAEAIGAINLFQVQTGRLAPDTVRLAHAMADVATVALLQERRIRQKSALTAQLQSALNSRVSVEQAKGMLAERLGTDLDGAFTTMRNFARSHNLKLGKVASDLVSDRTLLGDLEQWAKNH